jgi:hypothetical protein
MQFSDEFKIVRGRTDDWFDPILDTDTKLFVDPFLIFSETSEQWTGAHNELIAHFNRCFHLIAEGNRNPASIPYKKALALLTFPEPREFCLGYTKSGTDGAGGGNKYARLMARAMESAIQRGLTDLRHFEELGIINEGIGPDRISDFTCNILKSRFIAYTRAITSRLGLATEPFRIRGAAYDPVRVAWRTEQHELVRNPHSQKPKPILLVPLRFLRELPVLNADDWWENYEAQQLRVDVNYEILGKVDKKSIVAAARRNLGAVRAWTVEQEQHTPPSYDLAQDPKGVHQWDAAARRYVEAHPLAIQPPDSDDDFFRVIELVISEYQRFVEEQRGWTLLWEQSKHKAKPEEAAQLLFMGIARSYCRANNIVVDREVELGRGPVDFKFSNGYSRRALLEIKKLHNGYFWNGLEYQLPSYLESDDCPDAWYLALQYLTTGVSKDRRLNLAQAVDATAQRTGRNLRLRLIDVTPKESASKLRGNKRREQE